MGYIKLNTDGSVGSGIIAQEHVINTAKIILVRTGAGASSATQINFVTGILPDQDSTTPDNPAGYVEQISLKGTGFTADTVRRANDAIIAGQTTATGIVSRGFSLFKAAPGETFTHVNFLISKN
jgi:hypothetical protein|tara:strand:- start:4040 stop:4411 length:372 start_codon:yes stop_codon:yes gene_type:complete